VPPEDVEGGVTNGRRHGGHPTLSAPAIPQERNRLRNAQIPEGRLQSDDCGERPATSSIRGTTSLPVFGIGNEQIS